MSAEPYGVTLFCDDIRYETNGKITLVGCYSGDLTFTGPPPGTLPTFAALVNIRIPRSVPVGKLKLIVSKQEGDETVEVLTTEVDVTERELKRIADEAALDQKGEERVIAMTFPCRWSPLVIGQAGYLKVRAYLDDGREIRLGALKMKFSTNDEDTSDDHDR